MDAFAALSDPTRRRILGHLRRAPKSVGELAALLEINQPAVSKHLKVLRDAGFLSCRVAAQQRIYQLERERFDEIEKWLAPYRNLWNRHLDALEQFLDAKEKTHERSKAAAARTSRKTDRAGRK